MHEQENIFQRQRRKLSMIEVFLWYAGKLNPPPPDRREEATPYLLQQGHIEAIEAPPHNPPKHFRLTAKGEALLPQVETTYRKIHRRSGLGADLTGPDPLDEATYFD